MDQDYILAVIGQRCGPEFVAAVVPERIFTEVVLALEARVRDLQVRADGAKVAGHCGLKRAVRGP
jgi:hypothetical protein